MTGPADEIKATINSHLASTLHAYVFRDNLDKLFENGKDENDKVIVDRVKLPCAESKQTYLFNHVVNLMCLNYKCIR